MPEKMKVTKILHKEKVTHFTAVSPDGQVTRHMMCWRTPRTNMLLDNLKNGDTIVTDTIATIT